MGLLLGQVSKWRAQRADRGAHAARGFVGGATGISIVQCASRMEFQCRTRLCGWCNRGRRFRRSCAGRVSMPHAALWVVQLARNQISIENATGFNAARGFVGGATNMVDVFACVKEGFNAARGFVGSATSTTTRIKSTEKSFNAARGFVGGATARWPALRIGKFGFNAARGFVGGAAHYELQRHGPCCSFNAARGFVGGATKLACSYEENAGLFQCRTRLCGWCNNNAFWNNVTSILSFNAARGFVGGATADAKIIFVSKSGFNAARGFVGGATSITAFVLSVRSSFNAARGFVGGATLGVIAGHFHKAQFQCRTRLCGWCNNFWISHFSTNLTSFNAARGFVGGATCIFSS